MFYIFNIFYLFDIRPHDRLWLEFVIFFLLLEPCIVTYICNKTQQNAHF